MSPGRKHDVVLSDDDEDNPRRWTRRDAQISAVIMLAGLLVLGLIGTLVID